MTALFAGLTTLDVLHRLDHVPDPSLKVTSTDFTMAAGGPATNAAVTYAALCAASRILSAPVGEAGAASGTPLPSTDAPTLLTALGEGPVAAFLAADLAAAGVRVVDATAPAASPAPEAGKHPTDAGERGSAPASSRASREPAVSSIIEHPSGRMVASTNARLDADAGRIAAELPERVGAVLIDGHNPALAHVALTLGVPEVDGEDPFAPLEARPPHPRILDGGSWKDWLTPLLGFVDIAVVSEDFAPPQYWWDGDSGEVPVEAVPDASTLGAGDAFHGAFTWAIERGGDADPERLIRFASAVAAVSVSSFGTRQWLASPALSELVRG